MINDADLAARLLALPVDGARRVFAFDGRSGAGKTTVGGRVATELGAPIVHLDDFVPGWDGLAASVDRLVEWVLAPVAAGRPARWRRYDWDLGRYAEWHELAVDGLLVVEGSGCGARRAAPYVAGLVWVEAPDAVRAARLAAREDGPAYAPYLERWARQERAIVAADGIPSRADVVFENGAEARCDTTAAVR